MDAITIIAAVGAVLVPIGGTVGAYLGIRANARATVDVKRIETAPAVEVEKIKAASADNTARHATIVEQEKQQGETERAEITGTRDIVAAATAWGVAVAAQHRECEEARRRDARECDERISVLEKRFGIQRVVPRDSRREP